MSLPILYGVNPNSELVARALASAYRLFTHIQDPDYALQRDPSAWTKMWRDAKVAQLINQRLHAVVGSSWSVIPRQADEKIGEEIARVVNDALEDIEEFDEARLDLSQAIFLGRSYAFIESHRQWTTLDGKLENWWLPTRLVDVMKERIRIVPRREPTQRRIDVFEEMFSIETEQWEKLEHSELFCRVVYMDEERRLGYGRPLSESIYFTWWAKQVVWEEGLNGLERWAHGIIQGTVKRTAASDEKGIQKAIDDFQKDLHEMRTRHEIVTDEDHEIKIHQSTGQSGSKMISDMLEYCDNLLTGLIMGSILPFGSAQGVGSMSRAKTEQDTSDQLLQFDRKKIDASITRCIVKLFLKHNAPQLAKHGLIVTRPPKFVTVQKHHEDPLENAQVASMAGVPVVKVEFYERIGYSPPTDEQIANGETIVVGQGAGGGAGGDPFSTLPGGPSPGPTPVRQPVRTGTT